MIFKAGEYLNTYNLGSFTSSGLLGLLIVDGGLNLLANVGSFDDPSPFLVPKGFLCT